MQALTRDVTSAPAMQLKTGRRLRLAVREQPGVERFRRVGGDGARVPGGVGVAGRVGRRLVAGEPDELVAPTECLARVMVRVRVRVS